MFRICDILRRIRTLGSVHWNTDTDFDQDLDPDPDPAPDPDSAPSSMTFKMPTKN